MVEEGIAAKASDKIDGEEGGADVEKRRV